MKLDSIKQIPVSIPSAIALFAMMFVTFVDVVGRKFLSKPLLGAVEITELLMLICIFFAWPSVTWTKSHLQLDLFEGIVSNKLKLIQSVLSEMICAVAMFGVAYVLVKRTMQSYEEREVSALLQILQWPFHALLAFLLLITGVLHVVNIFRGSIREEHKNPINDGGSLE